MAFFEDRMLTDSIEIKTTPEKILAFLTAVVDDDSYRAWHQKDHVSLRWLKGKPWAEGSVLYTEEYLHGKLHKLKFKITKIVPNQKIEYSLVSRLVRKFFPKNEYIIEPKEDACRFIASGTYRISWLGKTFFKKAIHRGLAGMKKHMHEEGQNLKKVLENG